MTSDTRTVFRLHPAINFARLGTSKEYYLSPETSAGLPGDDKTVGGLPIKCGTEDETITSADLRDQDGHLKRQAARFRVFAYTFEGADPTDTYPNGTGTEILPGDTLPDGRKIKDIVWTVHLANKKSNAYNVVNAQGIAAYDKKRVPQLRNPEEYGDQRSVDPATRVRKLVIDPGPRAIRSSDRDEHDEAVIVPFTFDPFTVASYSDGSGGISKQPDYPKSYPKLGFPDDPLFEPSGPLDTLGELTTDPQGRLLVLPGRGKTAAWHDEYGQPMPLTGDLNNGGWFDDSADGPVSATIVFEKHAAEEAAGAWVVCVDPAYAPQIRNVVSVWDDVYDTWIRQHNLQPEIYADGTFQAGDKGYQPSFAADIQPIFRAAAMQRWTANLPDMAVKAHQAVDRITGDDDPDQTIMASLTYIRNPNTYTDNDHAGELNLGVPLMPLSLGDAGQAFLAVSKTQYFFLEQWRDGYCDGARGHGLGRGEYLDMAALSNCLGGRYVPGIEVSHTIRRPEMYCDDWRTSLCGPFRVKRKALKYARVSHDKPLLTVGWLPFRMTDELEPGDITKFMAVPWQTDYNSCSIHQTKINTAGRNTTNGSELTLYWSWPSQRPDAVYPASAVVNGVLPEQVWSIRGPGTLTTDPKTTATFQDPLDSVRKWDRIGIVLQATAIVADPAHPPEFFLEVGSQLPTGGQSVNVVPDWPFNANEPTPARRPKLIR